MRVKKYDGFNRLLDFKMVVIQGGVAAGLAWWAARHIVGHEMPFFAPMAAVIVLSTYGGKRIRRSFEIVLGASTGVGIGDLLISQIGSGTWQIMLCVSVALSAGLLIDRSPLVAIQAATSAVLIATLMPPGSAGGIDRMVDAFVGGMIGIAVIGLIPNSALNPARREISKVLGHAGTVLANVSAGLAQQDVEIITEALSSARGTQGRINTMIAVAEGSHEVTNVSPFLWSAKQPMQSIARILPAVDNTMRNSRVLARRAATVVSDHQTVDPAVCALLKELAEVAEKLAELFAIQGRKGLHAEADVLPPIIRQLRHAASAADPAIAESAGLSAVVVIAQIRSIIVDMLQVCGMSRESAVAVLRPTTSTPAIEPEIWEA